MRNERDNVTFRAEERIRTRNIRVWGQFDSDKANCLNSFFISCFNTSAPHLTTLVKGERFIRSEGRPDPLGLPSASHGPSATATI